MCKVCEMLVETVFQSLEEKNLIPDVTKKDSVYSFNTVKGDYLVVDTVDIRGKHYLTSLYHYLNTGIKIEPTRLDVYVRSNEELNAIMQSKFEKSREEKEEVKDTFLTDLLKSIVNDEPEDETGIPEDMPEEVKELIKAFGADRVVVVKL